jgi:hypothetical protein
MASRVPKRFEVAFSFAGEQHALVRSIAVAVKQVLGPSTVFLAEWFEHYTAGADGDVVLQDVYRAEFSTLVVLCVSNEQGRKPWTLTELDVIRERINKARSLGKTLDRLAVLPIRVGDGDVGGITGNTIVPDVRGRRPEETARLIVDRLNLIKSAGAASTGAPSPDPPEIPTPIGDGTAPRVVVEQIVDVEAKRALVRDALSLYDARIPEDQRIDRETMVDLVRRHLSGDFGPSWKMHFLVAMYGDRTVGLLVCYEDIAAHFAFISYLAAQNPRCRGRNPTGVSGQLATALMDARRKLELPETRFVFEVDDPAVAVDATERRRRIGRLKLFADLAPFEGLHVRVLDIPYVQPSLDWPSDPSGRQLLLCYAARGIGTALPKAEVITLLTWTYTVLYGDDVVEEGPRRVDYGRHTRQLLQSVVVGLPDEVRLVRSRDVARRAVK